MHIQFHAAYYTVFMHTVYCELAIDTKIRWRPAARVKLAKMGSKATHTNNLAGFMVHTRNNHVSQEKVLSLCGNGQMHRLC